MTRPRYNDLMKDETPDPIIPFGQHRGKTASQIDVHYLDWLIGQDWVRKPLKDQITAHLQTRADWHAMDDD